MLSTRVKEFLAKYVSSAELLDILMLMHREPDQVWTAESVSNRVFTVPQAAERRLEELEAVGLVRKNPDAPGTFVINDSNDAVKTSLADVRAAYEANRVEVVGAVFTMRADPLQSFSDAFRLRGDS